jgi:hypothetical protein
LIYPPNAVIREERCHGIRGKAGEERPRMRFLRRHPATGTAPDSPTRRRFLVGVGAGATAATAGAFAWSAGSEPPHAERPLPTPVRGGTGLASVDVREFGSAGDGTTDDAPAFEAALAESSHVYVPPGTYSLGRPLTLAVGTRLVGGGKYNTVLLHSHDGDFALLGARSSLADLTVEGQGDRYAGRGLVLTGSDGQQSLQSVAIVGFDGYCIDFETVDAGSQFRASQVDVGRIAAETGTNRFAIHIASGQQLAAVPRSFVQLETQGQCAIDFGACNNVAVAASTLGDLAFTSESRAVTVTASRILNQRALTVDGHAVTFVGCDISAQITIAPGADHVVLAPNAFNRLPVIDRSGNDRNQLPPPYSP